ncbi:MAG: hypothetical protein ACXVJT_11165, partial [Thermoanaerobaculia bacterium]
TLLRLGLWILVIVMAMYVIQQSFEGSPISEYVQINMLRNAMIVGAILLVAGIVTRVLEKGARKVVKNRCAVCRTPIPHGAIYCRAHLRSVLHQEDEKTHAGSATRQRR